MLWLSSCTLVILKSYWSNYYCMLNISQQQQKYSNTGIMHNNVEYSLCPSAPGDMWYVISSYDRLSYSSIGWGLYISWGTLKTRCKSCKRWQEVMALHHANKRRWPNVDLLLGHRLRRWPNNKSTLGQSLVFNGLPKAQEAKSSPNSGPMCVSRMSGR